MADLIERKAAIDALGKAPKYKTRIIKTYAEGRNDQWFDDVAKLTLLPSAQPQSKKGKWITVEGRFGNEVECNQCNSVFWYWMGNYRFCPSCGAEMRGEEHD